MLLLITLWLCPGALVLTISDQVIRTPRHVLWPWLLSWPGAALATFLIIRERPDGLSLAELLPRVQAHAAECPHADCTETAPGPDCAASVSLREALRRSAQQPRRAAPFRSVGRWRGPLLLLAFVLGGLMLATPGAWQVCYLDYPVSSVSPVTLALPAPWPAECPW